ncbi:Tad domain-containing protein [Qipengyuania sp. 6B39]|uniref:Tad domain-containing protein n=1 Tax=Qipengyuania proteolytica TaxID=2867239 RepID=UPI001C89C512|nr:Tad domain-containing protein [Qipengyuania proteolytica]MBX7496139.1 Tad domain-containing protein [Qipengyuania proteolytica]
MFDRLKSLLREVRDDRSGNVLTLMGLSMIPLIGTLGLAVDAAQWISWKRDLRSAADSAAMAGGLELKNSGNAERVNAAVRKVLGYNTQHAYTIVAVETPPTAGTFAGQQGMVRVVLSTSQKLPFSSLFLPTTPVIRVEAVAQASSEVANCMVALAPSGIAMSITGAASVNMNCGMQSNSNFDATATGSINAGALSAVGTVNEGNRISGTTAINNGVVAEADPYAGVITDPNEVCSNWPLISGTNNPPLTPGCYKGIQVQANAKITLSPGTYYLGEKGLSIGGNATVIGNEVTLVFTNTASPFNSSKIGTFSAQGTSTVQLTSPSTGTYAGILMHQDSRTPFSNTTRMFITGDSRSQFDGAIYAPSTEVAFSGNSGMTTDCLQIIAWYVTFTGSTSVSNSCPSGRGVVSYSGEEVLRLRQ